MRKNSIITVLFIFGMAAACCAAAAIEIWMPRQISPAFVEPGGTFNAEIRGDAGLSASGWSVLLENDLRAWNCGVISAVYSTINCGTESGWRLAISVPAGTSPELFKLNVSHTAGGSASRVNSVSVVRNFETSFYVVQLTDEQIDKNAAAAADGYRSAQLVGWAAPVINLINPRLVLNTGDEVENAWESTDNKFQWYNDAKTGYGVPCVTVKGNNDSTVDAKWELYFGQRSFSFRMGSFYVLAHDFTDASLLAWASEDYSAAYGDPSVGFRLVAQHAWSDASAGAFIPDTGKPCGLMLMGHNHANGIKQSNPYYALYTQSAERYANGGFFEFVKTGQNWSCPSPLSGHSGGSDNIQLAGDWGAARVSAAYALPNDGTRASNTVTVTNKVSRNFYDGRVRFLAPSGKYAVTGAEKIAEYSYAGGSKTAVLAKVNIPAAGGSDGTAAVILEKTGPEKIRIVSEPFTINSVETSPVIIINALDGTGAADASFSGTACLFSSSSRGEFSVSGTEWKDTDVISLNSGSGIFYYRDRKGGSPVITVSRPDLELFDTQAAAVTQPFIRVVKSQRNSGSETPVTGSIAVAPGSAIEYTITINNTGSETASDVTVFDAKAFDTLVNNPVSFIRMDTFPPADSWAYTSDPALAIWHNWGSVPAAGQENVKGLRWKIAKLGVLEARDICFSVRVK